MLRSLLVVLLLAFSAEAAKLKVPSYSRLPLLPRRRVQWASSRQPLAICVTEIDGGSLVRGMGALTPRVASVAGVPPLLTSTATLGYAVDFADPRVPTRSRSSFVASLRSGARRSSSLPRECRARTAPPKLVAGVPATASDKTASSGCGHPLSAHVCEVTENSLVACRWQDFVAKSRERLELPVDR